MKKKVISYSDQDIIHNRNLLLKLLESKFPEHQDELSKITMTIGPMARMIIKSESITKDFAEKIRAELPKSIK